jgi:hypothetical protein
MNHKTKQTIQEIKNKTKSKVTGLREFATDESVIDFAVQLLITDLKKKGVL